MEVVLAAEGRDAVTVEVQPDWTVGDLAAEAERVLGKPAHLYFGGVSLARNTPLSDTGMVAGGSVTVRLAEWLWLEHTEGVEICGPTLRSRDGEQFTFVTPVLKSADIHTVALNIGEINGSVSIAVTADLSISTIGHSDASIGYCSLGCFCQGGGYSEAPSFGEGDTVMVELVGEAQATFRLNGAKVRTLSLEEGFDEWRVIVETFDSVIVTVQ